MVAGHLQVKKGLYYVVLSYHDVYGKRKTKWIPTRLPMKGNKKRAEEILMKERTAFREPTPMQEMAGEQFADYLEQWLEMTRHSIERTTFASYKTMLNSTILPHFRSLKVTLNDLKPAHIQAYYGKELQRVKAVTVIHYHCVIRKALQYAVKTDLIPSNPATRLNGQKRSGIRPASTTAMR